ncbi:MAG: MurR/RpiR family transcriptional regulator [Lachnospiraceae bacterium]|jgi:DNA-binding MurR/RpiR family transcriptional regulator
MAIVNNNVLVQLRELRNSLTPVGKQLADFILDDPKAILTMPIKTLAQKSRTSDAAVIRFCKSLGFDGYRSFIVSISATLAASKDTSSSNNFSDIQPGDDLESIVKNISFSNHQSIDDTLSIINMDTLEQAVSKLLSAEKIIFCGIGASGLVCMDAQQKFMRIGRAVEACTDGHFQLTLASLLGEKDVAVLISNSGETKDILDTLEVLLENHVYTIAITRYNKSPLASKADLSLYISTPEILIRSGAMGSRIAMLTLIDILYASVVSRDYTHSKASLTKTRKALAYKRF